MGVDQENSSLIYVDPGSTLNGHDFPVSIQEAVSPQPSRKTRIFDSHNNSHRKEIAKIIANGGIGAFTFNGIYGIFGAINDLNAVEGIHEAKNRPLDKGLISVYLPELVGEICDLSKIQFENKQKSLLDFGKDKELRADLVTMWRKAHALGLILPISEATPKHLIKPHIYHPEVLTVLSIWTEYNPVRELLYLLRDKGIRGLVGTSANLAGQGTHHSFEDLRGDFVGKVDFLARDDFSKLHEIRRRSTSIIDFTDIKPRLHRGGNVSDEELIDMIDYYFETELEIPKDVIRSAPRR